MGAMGVIFLSYASADRERVAPLARELETLGWDVWWDRHIPPGRTFDEVIEEALDAADVVVCVWTHDAAASRWVRTEAAEGLAHNVLVPVSLDDVRIPLAFRRIQSADLTDWQPGSEHSGFDELVRALEALIGRPRVEDSASDSAAGPDDGVAGGPPTVPSAESDAAPSPEPEVPPPISADDGLAARALGLARTRASEQDWDGVIEVLEALEDDDPDALEARPEAGDLLDTARRKRRAAELFDEAEILYTDGRWDDVIARLDQVREIDPDDSFADGLRARAERHVERRRRYIDEEYARATAALDSRQWSVAVARLERLVSEAPDHPDAATDLERARVAKRADDRYQELHERYRDGDWESVVAGVAAFAVEYPDFGDPDNLMAAADARLDERRETAITDETASESTEPHEGDPEPATHESPEREAAFMAPATPPVETPPTSDTDDTPPTSDTDDTDSTPITPPADTPPATHGTPPIRDTDDSGDPPATPRRLWWIGAIAAAVLLVVAAVVIGGGGDDNGDDAAESAEQSDTASESAGEDAAGSGDGPDQESAGEPSTEQPEAFDGQLVTVAGPETSDAEVAGIQAALDAFGAEANLNIVYSGDPDWSTTVETQLSAGDPPNIGILPLLSRLGELARAGVLVQVRDDVVASVTANWSDDYWTYGTTDGVQYGVPVGNDVVSLVWHQPTRLAGDGYEVPSTFDEVVAIVDEMAIRSGPKPLCVGIESGDATGWVFVHATGEMVLRLHGADVYDQWLEHEIPFNDPRIVESMQVVVDLWSDDNVFAANGTIATTSFAANPGALAAGDCYLHRQGNFLADVFPDGTSFSDGSEGAVDVFALPGIGGDRPVLSNVSLAVAFDDQPETAAVLAYMATATYAERRQVAQAEAQGGSTSGYLSAVLGQDTSVYTPLEQRFVGILAEATVTRPLPDQLMPEEVGFGTFRTEGTALVNGQIDAQTAADNIEASWPTDG